MRSPDERSGDGERGHLGWGARIFWFVLLWGAGVATLAVVGTLIRFALQP